MKAVLPALARALVEPHIPAGVEAHWFATAEEAAALAADADIGWLDVSGAENWGRVVSAAGRLRWLSTANAGLDSLPRNQLAAQGTRVTNGSGNNAHTVAEYAVMGALIAAKRFDQVLSAASRHDWLPEPTPDGRVELYESNALVLGYGTVGRLIGERLAAFGVKVTGVTRSGRDDTIGPEEWRPRLGQFDWIFLAAPATDETVAMIGPAELAAMKPSAWIINFGRGALIDQGALIAALRERRVAGAFLDTVTPEPLPPEHPLWTAPNAILSMHLSGRSQSKMLQRSADLFVENLRAFVAGQPLRNEVDLAAGY